MARISKGYNIPYQSDNHIPTQHLAWKSSAESLQNALDCTIIQPNISHLRVYGCKTYTYISEKVREEKKYYKLIL